MKITFGEMAEALSNLRKNVWLFYSPPEEIIIEEAIRMKKQHILQLILSLMIGAFAGFIIGYAICAVTNIWV